MGITQRQACDQPFRYFALRFWKLIVNKIILNVALRIIFMLFLNLVYFSSCGRKLMEYFKKILQAKSSFSRKNNFFRPYCLQLYFAQRSVIFVRINLFGKVFCQILQFLRKAITKADKRDLIHSLQKLRLLVKLASQNDHFGVPLPPQHMVLFCSLDIKI